MGRARALAIMCASPFVVLAAACSVFSGWSDLQEGEGETSGDASNGGRVDAATRDGTTPTSDARFDTGGNPGNAPVVCGGQTCAPGLGCCVFSQTIKTCTDPAACEDQGAIFLECTGRASCALTGLDCCIGSQPPIQADCTAACPEQSKVVVCDPSEAEPCKGGKPCNMTLGNLGLMYCGE